MKSSSFNKKVAKHRGLSWRKKLIAGKFDVLMNPTRLRVERIKRKMSQTDIATKLKMSLATYGAIERGIRAVKTVRVDMISKSLGLPASKLFKKSAKFKHKLVAMGVEE